MKTTTPTAEELTEKLTRERSLKSAKEKDRLARMRDQADREREERAIRREAARDRNAAALEKAKLAADLAQSAEARVLRVQRTRALTLAVLLPILAAFGVWSTAGVHAGATTLLGAEAYSPMWWALWLLEPALLGTVAWIIVCRARLSSSGGDLDDQAEHIMWGCLSVSILLNAIGHWPTVWPAGFGALLVHSLGPVGAAMTAHLIGLIEDGVSRARPSEGPGVRTLADLSRKTGDHSSQGEAEEPSESAAEHAQAPLSGWVQVPAGTVLLPLVARTPRRAITTGGRTTPGKPQRTTADQGGDHSSEEGARPRPNKGRKVPPSARKSAPAKSARALSDEELAEQLATAIADSGVSQEPSVAAVQKALGIGFERAKRVMALHSQKTAGPALSVVSEDEEAA
ncbi:hypothetical protein J0910_01565 [Nocardiopsis sp. CNT-189]|uniref:hypothetical protein n=1 Tax=Nocardiopsis oceanisediminis TaxID=2816862 RepID=UPI003B31CFEB